jgi:carboxymethylenebutenolidase
MREAGGKWRQFESPHGEIRAFVEEPRATSPWPTLILIHPIMGVTERIRNLVASFAVEGYYTVAPNLYSKDARHAALSVDSIEAAAHMQPRPESWETYLQRWPEEARAGIRDARDWISSRPTKAYAAIVESCYADLRGAQNVGPIGCIGYCQGGRLTLELAATGAELACGVVYYGGHPGVAAAPRIRCPIQGHYGVTDEPITSKVYEFAAAMHEAGREFAYCVYNAGHGFADHDGEVTTLAHERTLKFLGRNLKGIRPS